MKKRQLIKKIVALTLAALIGLSAMSGLIMAFAVPEEVIDSMPDPINWNPVDISMDEEIELTVLDESLKEAIFHFDDAATFTVAPGENRKLWLGWDDLSSPTMDKLSDKYAVSFDVLNFVFVTRFQNKGTMTIATNNPYLYTLVKGELVPVETVYKDGVHTFQTDTLDCFLASNGKITL